MKRILLALALLLAPSVARADLDFYFREQTDTRYDAGDLVDVAAATGTIPVPNTSPFMIVRVTTTKTKEEVMGYLAPGPSGKRRSYYLDTTKMSAEDLTYWNTNRTITTLEATAVGWLSRK